MTDEAENHVCSCIRLYCWHEKGKCDEPPFTRFGQCFTCKTYTEPRRCKTCGQVVPEVAEKKP